MKLVEINSSDKERYNRFVAEQPSGSFLQSWEWGEWQKNEGHEVFRFMIEDNGHQIGAVQFIKMPVVGNYYYVYAPYGPVIAAGDNFQFPISNFQKELQKRFSSALFFRIEPCFKLPAEQHSLLTKTINIQPAITMMVDLSRSEDEVLAGMHQKTRYNIRLAQKHGVVVESDLLVTPGHGLYTSEAIELILDTQHRQQYRGHSKDHYKQLVNFFAMRNNQSDLKLRIYRATFNKQLLASGIMMDFGSVRMYLHGGSSDDHREVMAPYLMHWQAMVDAKELGMTKYDLGGSEVASGGEKGFTRFKKGFGGEVVEFSGAYDIVNSKIWYTIYTLGRKINRFLKHIHK